MRYTKQIKGHEEIVIPLNYINLILYDSLEYKKHFINCIKLKLDEFYEINILIGYAHEKESYRIYNTMLEIIKQ